MIHLRHRWKSVSVQHLSYATNTGGDWKSWPKKPVTEVLQRCECGHLRTVTLDGEWALEEVQR